MTNQFEIRDQVLVHCTVNEADVVIPEGVKEVKSYAFKEDEKIESVVFPTSCERIEGYALAYKGSLKRVTILGPAEVGEKAFLSCHNLKEVYLADGVKSIGSMCFAFCDKIHDIYIPRSVVEIGSEIACMNDASYRYPLFLCARRGPGKLWDEDWNLIWHDSRFGNDKNHSFYHDTNYNMPREEDEAQYEKRETIRMPHGTGVRDEGKDKIKGVRIPEMKLKLVLRATKKVFAGDTEYKLVDEEREFLPDLIRDKNYEGKVLHRLDEPWEVTINNDSYNLAPELGILAMIDTYNHPYDGETLTISHDMPWREKSWDKPAITRLKQGDTAIAEKYITNGNFMDIYAVRLYIHWPQQEMKYYTRDEAIERIRQQKEAWKEYTDGKNELLVRLAHGNNPAEDYKRYNPSVFPEAFIEDMKADGDRWNDLGEISIQPLLLYRQHHDISDDLKCAYGVSDDDDTGWYTVERAKTGKRLSLEIKQDNNMNTAKKTTTPDFTEYLKKEDLTGYLRDLHREAEKDDIGSLHALLFLAVRLSDGGKAVDYAHRLSELEDPFGVFYWDFIMAQYESMSEEDKNNDDKITKMLKMSYPWAQQAFPDHPDFEKMYLPSNNQIFRGYLNHVGEEIESEVTEEDKEVELHECASEETKANWRSLYRRSDCSTNQQSIYYEAMSYAKQGDPYAMYIVGYLLSHGIETKYSTPKMVYLEVDKDKALPWLERATEADIPQAYWEAASIWLDRCRRNDHSPEMFDKAQRYILRGAELDDVECLRYLVEYSKDDKVKFNSLLRLVEVDSSHKSRLQLANCYEKGIGCEVNPEKAFEQVEYVWKHSSCSPYDDSYETACSKLASYLNTGFGCEKDPERAGSILSSYDDEEDRMMELLCK